jgi:hypothetical protein
MRGPYERLKYDLRRLWECPVCKRRERTPGSVTFKHCLCQMQQLDGQPVVMKLIEDGVQRVAPAVVVRHEAAEAAEAKGSGFEVPVSDVSAPMPDSGAPQE